MMDKVGLKTLLNEKMGLIHQLMVAGDVQSANAALDELVNEIFEELDNG